MEPDKSFFDRDTETVAKELIGCTLEKDEMKGRIVETEAYLEDDPASHAYPKKTDRNKLMYESYGNIYVYLCYGVHHMLNFTTEKGAAGGVLIRALEPLECIEKMKHNRGVEDEKELCNGPGKICEALDIDKTFNGKKIGEEIKIEKGNAVNIEKSTRIGISKAVDRELRFYDRKSSHVSQY